MHINFEFKARVDSIEALESRLLQYNPEFKGEDHQVDTYFNVHNGRMKLRQGNIENALIWYEREDTAAAKQSNVILYQHSPNETLKQVLTASLGIKTVVDKKRKIYFIDNVKFHFDRVAQLGSFIEVEAIDRNGDLGIEKLKAQCDEYARLFDIQPSNYMAKSYSDMMIDSECG